MYRAAPSFAAMHIPLLSADCNEIEEPLTELYRCIFPRGAQSKVRVRYFDSNVCWQRALLAAQPAIYQHLKAWAEISVPSFGTLQALLPTIANQSKALGSLFWLPDSASISCRSVRKEWGTQHGERLVVALDHFIPRRDDIQEILCLLWMLSRAGGKGLPEKVLPVVSATLQILQRCAAFVVLPDGEALVCRNPKILRFDEQGRLSCAEAPAIVWANGTELWYLCDEPLPPEVALELSQLAKNAEEVGDRGSGVAAKESRVREHLRRSLAEYPQFATWFFLQDLRANRFRVLDQSGPWMQAGRVTRRACRLVEVVRGDEKRHYVQEIAEIEGKFPRTVEVPVGFETVDEALAWTFDPMNT